MKNKFALLALLGLFLAGFNNIYAQESDSILAEEVVEETTTSIRRGVLTPDELLIEYNLCFDALIKSIHLPHLLHFLRQNPTLRCVINHGAKPNIASGEWDSWKTGIAKIAQQTDAFCKISGLITETSDEQDYSVLAPYIDYLVNQFGPERLIWGSDWPVLNLAADYLSWYQAAQGLLNNLNLQEKELVFGLNAQKAYQLKLS